MNHRVLITGANGFIGSHLVSACLKRGMEVHAAIRKNSDMTLFNSIVTPSEKLTFLFPEYGDPEQLTSLFSQYNYHYIVHNAGITKAKNEETYHYINAEITRNLGKALQQSKSETTRRFIHISSLAAEGPLLYSGEGARPAPVTAYGRSKLLAERYLKEIPGLPLTVIRPTAVYGPGEKDLFIVFNLLSKGWDLNIGSAPQKLTFIYVDDLVDAILLAMDHPSSGEPLSFDISDGHIYNRYALSEAFAASTGKRGKRIHVPITLVRGLARLNEIYASVSKGYPALNKDKISELTAENWYCDIRPARRILGFNPKHDLNQGVNKTLLWYQSNNWF